MSPYLPVLRAPGVVRLLASQLTARLPAGMVAIGVLLQAQSVTGSFGFAGMVVAVLSLGQAVAGPLGGRAVGRWGARRVILVCAIGSGALLVAIAAGPILVRPFPPAALFGLAAGAGFLTPPVQPAARTIYQRLVAPGDLPTLLALDASLQEIIFVIAPVAITVVCAQFGPPAGVLVIAAILVSGCLWFALSPEVDRVALPRAVGRIGSVAIRPAVLLGILVGLSLVAASSAVEVAVVAAFVDSKLVAGLLLALYSLTSLVGGVVSGVMRARTWSLSRRLLLVVAGLVICAVAPGVWGIGIGLFIAGLGVAPALALTYILVSRTVAFTDTAEAYGWLGAGVLVGAAVGAAGGGLAIEIAGVGGAFAVAAVLAAAGAAVAVSSVPALRRELARVSGT